MVLTETCLYHAIPCTLSLPFLPVIFFLPPPLTHCHLLCHLAPLFYYSHSWAVRLFPLHTCLTYTALALWLSLCPEGGCHQHTSLPLTNNTFIHTHASAYSLSHTHLHTILPPHSRDWVWLPDHGRREDAPRTPSRRQSYSAGGTTAYHLPATTPPTTLPLPRLCPSFLWEWMGAGERGQKEENR